MDRVRGRSVVVTVAAVVMAALGACSGGAPAAPGAGAAKGGGLGVLVVPGLAKGFSATADGAWLAWLDGCAEARGRFLPPGTSSCDLSVVRAAGGAPVRVARGVPSLPQGLLAAPEGGTFAALADYDWAAGAGRLVVVRDGVAREAARGVTFHGFVPGGGGAVAAIAGGRLLVAGPGDGISQVKGAEGVASFTLVRSPAGPSGLARRPAAAGGGLLLLPPGLAVALPIAERTSEFAVSPDGTRLAWTVVGKQGTELFLGGSGSPRRLGGGARAFAFAAAGPGLAWVSEAAPGRQGDLWAAAGDGPATALGREVGEYRWAAAAPRLAWLERYDPRSRAGVLGVGGPGMAPRTFGKNVTDFELSPDGTRVAFLRHTTDGGYSVNLELADAEAAPGTPARTVARGVFGFAFSPDGAWLYYRTRCTRQAEACDLERLPAGGPAEAKPEAIAQGAKSFEFDPRDPERLLVTWQRADLVALDLAVWQGGRLTSVDQGALPGSARFLGPDSRRLGYAVVQPKRAGLHVAALPAGASPASPTSPVAPASPAASASPAAKP